jgi:hypothetical protein
MRWRKSHWHAYKLLLGKLYREPAVGLTGRDPGPGLGSHLFDLVFLLWRFQLDCATAVMMHRQFAGTDRLSHTSQARREVGHQTALCLLPRLRGRSSCSGEHYGMKAEQKHGNSTLTLTLNSGYLRLSTFRQPEALPLRL